MFWISSEVSGWDGLSRVVANRIVGNKLILKAEGKCIASLKLTNGRRGENGMTI